MLHPVGGAMGVTYAMMRYEGDTPGSCIISLKYSQHILMLPVYFDNLYFDLDC